MKLRPQPHIHTLHVRLLLGVSLCALSFCAVWAQDKTPKPASIPVSPEAVTFFETNIRPLLAEKCFECHGETMQKGGLRLDTRVGLLTGGTNGAVVIAGKPDESALLKAVHYDGALKMPPSGKLTPAQIADLTTWVKTGAVWPEDRQGDKETGRQGGTLTTPQAKLDSLSAYPVEKRKFWSFQAIKNPALPVVKNTAWCQNPIDRFVLARLEAKGLNPAPAADRRTLIRRVTFDLTGLPPTPEESDAFVKDKSSNAWEKVVDRLLASPRYGERWGRHWLDVVRYADSLDARGVGSEGDISEAWRYRDWVVNAFNRDLPYNQFMKYQIAGDLLPVNEGKGNGEKGKEETKAVPHDVNDVNVEGTIATGLLAIGNWGNGDADKDKILTDIADDQVDVVSRSMMGLTVACARCHDHKFDPIPTKDYYGLAGIFFSTHILPKLTPKGAGENILRIPLETKADAAKRAEYQQQMASVEKQLAQERRAQIAANALKMLPQTGAYVQAAWQYEHRPTAEAGVTLDAFAQAKGLQAWALRQWRDYLGLGDYPLMMQATAEVSGIKGLSSWRGKADCPNLLVNSTDTPRTISTLTIPPRSVAVHPGPTNGVVVAWRSPISGVVRITGRVADADPNGGDGIAWAIDQRGASSPHELASGDFPNGGAQDFMQGKNANHLQSVTVRQGERLEFVVLPKQDYTCDTTVIEVNIAEFSSNGSTGENKEESKDKGGRVWNLTRDIVDDPLQGGKGNPHTDRYGNAGVWAFEDMADRHRALPAGGPQNDALAQWRQAAIGAGDASTADATVQQASEAFGRAFTLADEKSPFWINSAADDAALPAASRETLTKLTAQLETLKKNVPPPIAYANGAQEGGVPESPHAGVHDVRIHIRGSYARLGDLAPRHFPIVLAGDKQSPITQGSGRLQLSEWLASDKHPLTPRVWVNRVWQRHFGQGIVRTPSNFGYLGERPTHPELLDWLAYHFVEKAEETRRQGGMEQNIPEHLNTRTPEHPASAFACNWSTKKLHKLILLSATYQQASEARPDTYRTDPDNRLWGRMNRQRLESEAIRDNLLSAAGRLDTTMGGVGYRDFATPRRTLYYMTIRSDRTGFGPLFDVADSTASVEKRTVSTVAPQSLYLLNNPFVLEQTRALAERLKKEISDGSGSDAGRIRRAYVLLYGRPVTPAEIAIGTAYLQRARAALKEGPAWDAYCQLLLCANEFVYVD